jgi:hypothetical protein
MGKSVEGQAAVRRRAGCAVVHLVGWVEIVCVYYKEGRPKSRLELAVIK